MLYSVPSICAKDIVCPQQIFIEGLLYASHCGYWGHHSELDGLAALKEITFHSRLHRVKDKCMPGSDVSVNCKR